MKRIITNKELSWLSFNARVLQEAGDKSVPLLERIKFLGIFSNNLDEFFRVRVATLRRIAKMGHKAKKFIGHNPSWVLREIHKTVLKQNSLFEKTYRSILRDLSREKIYIIDETKLNHKQKELVKSYFYREVRSKLIPIMIDQVQKFPVLRDDVIYLGVCLSKKSNPGNVRYALIEIPDRVLSRFIVLPQIGNKKYVILLDDVIRYSLPEIFSVFKYNIFNAYTIKLTRDAELDIDSDLSDSLIKKVSKSLRMRKAGNPVRFVYDENMPKEFLNLLIKNYRLRNTDTLIPGGKYHNFRDFMNFPDFGLKRLKYETLEKLPHFGIDRSKTIMENMEKRDILLHYAYQSFDYFIDLLREASVDPFVTSIKITIYRSARYSSVMNALINAAKNGKAVVAVLELQARFDEEANIYWANRLREEGVRVIYGVPGLKVHSKLCLITKKNRGKFVCYAVIGTGNFHEETAKIYSDHSLFTSNSKITAEVRKVFEFFRNNFKITPYKHLILSPFSMRKKFCAFINREIKNRKNGRNAYIIIKANNLTDKEIILKLYKASSNGVPIKLMIRGMYSLIAGIPNLSENIEARGIIDRYLEHSRIFVFCNDDNPKYFISSTDLMPRNLDSRVEVTCPIYDKEVKKELRYFLNIQWADNVKARVLDKKLNNKLYTQGKRKIRAQKEIYKHLKQKL